VRSRFARVVRPHSHDASDSVDDAPHATTRGIRAVKISLVVLAVTAALQVTVVAISGSVALLADTIHNFSDALTALPLWVAFVVGRRAASRRFTYGYGRGEDLAGLLMIAVSAVLVGWEAIRRLVDAAPVQRVGWVAAAGLIGFAGNELVALYRTRVGRGRPPWWPTGCTPARTDLRRWPWFSEPQWFLPDGPWRTRWLAFSSR